MQHPYTEVRELEVRNAELEKLNRDRKDSMSFQPPLPGQQGQQVGGGVRARPGAENLPGPVAGKKTEVGMGPGGGGAS